MTIRLSITMALILAWATPSLADVFYLRDGGRVRGELLNPKQVPRLNYRIRTKQGGVVLLNKTQVRQVDAMSAKMLEYQRRRDSLDPSIDSHWKLAEWCKAQDLQRQREYHLTQILAIDPNHKNARYALGYSKLNGEWSREEERMTKRGLVRFQRGWRTRQEVRIITERQAYEAKEIEWKRNVRTWRSWIRGGRRRKVDGIAKISKIRDPMAAGVLVKLLNSKKEPSSLKLLYLDAIANMPNHVATSGLIKRALEDPNEDVRNRAIAILKRYKSRTAVQRFIDKLSSKDNKIVNRAGKALGEMKDPSALPHLINALTTKHKFQVSPGRAPGSIGAGFGSGAGQGGLSVGGNKPRYVVREIRNEYVYQALMGLNPGVNFLFNKAKWRYWYVQANTPRNVNLRRDN